MIYQIADENAFGVKKHFEMEISIQYNLMYANQVCLNLIFLLKPHLFYR